MKLLLRLLLCCVLLGAGCDSLSSAARHVDADWHRRALIDGHLARWLAVAPTSSGLFATRFDRNWQARPQDAGDLTTQSRLIYGMLGGFELTGERRYLEAAQRGGDFLLAHFHDPLYGGFYNRVAADGKVVSDAKPAYGNAFALFALSHLYRVTRDERYRAAALMQWRDIDQKLRDADGGYRHDVPRNFVGSNSDSHTQNPLMHLFEALLALVEATGDPQALAGATRLGNFVIDKLMQGQPDGSAYIPEWYDAHWKPLPTKDKGGYIDLGHQFEWSHLLRSAAGLGLSPTFGATGERLLQYALKVGYDETNGGAFYRAYPDGSVDRGKGAWEQAECLRALVAAAAASGRRDLWRRYEQTLDFVRSDFIDAEHGGWKLGPEYLCGGGDCASMQMEPYHMTGMHLAAIRAAEAAASAH